MTAYRCVIRVAKLRTYGNIAASGGHTWREFATPNADPDRTRFNTDLRPVAGSAALVEAVKARVGLATEQASDPVLAIEYLVTAHHAAFREHGGDIDPDAYLRDALTWIEARHGVANVVAAQIQRDEQAPHLVVYVVPLIEVPGKTRKRSVIVPGTNADGTRRRETREFPTKATIRLSAAHYIGGRQLLREMQTQFHLEVGRNHGLLRGVPGSQATHQTVQQYYAGLEEARKKPITPAISAEDVQPVVLRQTLLSTTRESPEHVADRLRSKVQTQTSGLASVASQVEAALKRADEMAKTADWHATRVAVAEQEASAWRQLRNELTAEQQIALLAHAEAMRVENRLVAERQRRVDRIAEMVKTAAGAALVFCTRALDAIRTAAGDWRTVPWRAVEKDTIEESVYQHRLTKVSAVQAVLDLSPAQAGVDANEADRMLEDAARFDEAVAEEAETFSAEHGPAEEQP